MDPVCIQFLGLFSGCSRYVAPRVLPGWREGVPGIPETQVAFYTCTETRFCKIILYK